MRFGLAQLTSYDSAKRLMDVLGALTSLLFAMPLMILVALLVKLTSPGPVVYRQKRLTKGGRVFEMFKFRTMVVDAESKTGPVWAEKGDPRVTPIGKVLRFTRFDELPQLVNILLGDMSLIGPRPERPEIAAELAKEIPDFNRRLEVKAGLSGLAQVSRGYASSLESYRKKLEYDLFYIDNRSFLLDVTIALKTIIVITTGRGSR